MLGRMMATAVLLALSIYSVEEESFLVLMKDIWSLLFNEKYALLSVKIFLYKLKFID